MTLRALPEIRAERLSSDCEFGLDPDALERWNAALVPQSRGETTISILDLIGEDWMGDGVGSRRVSAALRSIGAQDVVVDINSPGGDFFEGIAIYNLLRDHPHKVTVRVLGQAYSAASVIAMAGDEVQIASTAHMMVHCAWGIVIGNQFDLVGVLEQLKPYDESMAKAYAEKASVTVEEAMGWMSKDRGDGTFFDATRAIEAGLADALMPADQVIEDETRAAALQTVRASRRVDASLAKQGIPRSERRALLAEVKGGTSRAAPTATHDAGDFAALAEGLFKI